MRNLLLIAILLTLPAISLAQITSTFDIDADGWFFFDGGTGSSTPGTFNAAGGNPGGYISLTYSSNTSFEQSWVAPGKFLGNQVTRSLGMNLLFSLQQSAAGASSFNNGEVRIESGGTAIVVTLTPKPAVAPSWTNYSLRLDETQVWRIGSTTGPVATRTQIIQVLTNITALEIRGTYMTNAAYTSGLDNVILEQRAYVDRPVITSFIPTSGLSGSTVTITGNNFDPLAANNSVYFGNTAATITSASTTSIVVVVPAGASFGRITVVNKTSGKSFRSLVNFNPIFAGGGRIIPASFKPRFTIDHIGGMGGLQLADMDGDGWNDLVVANQDNSGIQIYRNLGTGGPLSTSSFASPVLFPTLLSGTNGAGITVRDLDNDGKLDMVTSGWTGGPGAFATYRNISSPGNLSFQAVETWNGATDESPVSSAEDIDGDGLIDLVGGEGSSPGSAWIIQNISTPGDIEFGYRQVYFSGGSISHQGATLADLDGDGKPEFIHKIQNVLNQQNIHVNTSTPGNISFGPALTLPGGIQGSMVAYDFNKDGKNDLAWKDGFSNDDIYIRLNANSGGPLSISDFSTQIILDSETGYYGGISMADINGDGEPDLLATDSDKIGVFENNYSAGVFDASDFIKGHLFSGVGATTYPGTTQAADLNGDGKPEMVIGTTNTTPAKIVIYENQNLVAPEISITTVSPLQAPIGATVMITGSNFAPVATDNFVYFGGIRAPVLTASATELTVSVPPGAGHDVVSVRVGELTSAYHLPFHPTFSSGVPFNNTHFAPPVEFALANADYDIEVADLDNDGKPDVAAQVAGTNRTAFFSNSHGSGFVSTGSLTAAGTTANTATNPKLFDIDGNGFIDIVGVSGNMYQNTSSPGAITFGPQLSLGLGAGNFAFADFNRDGKIDLAATNGGSAQLLLLENRSISGSLVAVGTFGSFSNDIAIAKPAAGGGIVAGDFDADGFPDVIVTNPSTDNLSIFPSANATRVNAATFGARIDIATGDNPGRVYTGDFDDDNKLDFLIYHGTGTNATLLSVFHNQSTPGNFSFNRIDLTNPSATTVAHIADLDGDGRLEIITTSEAGNRFSIFKNIHTGGALTPASFSAPFNTTVTAPRGITTGDLNLDGKPEIIITRAAGFLVVYENLIGNPLITSFDPTSGPVGTTVTITGENFSSTPANNIVTFNGITAVVTASTPTSITTTVPAGATTGLLSVTVSGATGISATPFTVTFPVLIPGLVWARAHVGTTDTFSEAVAVDASGNVFTTGSFDNTTDFDPGPGVLNLTATGSVSDIYLSKLNANGDLVWAFSLGCLTSGAGTGIATDAAGNVYVAGYFSGTVDFDPGPGTTNLTGGGRFLCKYDTNGNLIWALALASTLSVDLPMAVDAADNLYITGSFSTTADFDPGAGTFNMTSAGSSDIFILKLSSSGTFIWARRMGSTSLDRANALVLDATGNVHLTGSFNGTVDFDPGAGTVNLTSAGATDAFIQKLDNAGNYIWARRVGGTSALDNGNGIALDGGNNVLITGRFDGTVDFDPGAAVNNLTSVGGGDAFVLKLTSAGIFDWAKSMGGTFGEEGMGIVCDAFDNVYTTGDLRSNTADFDPGPGTFNLSRTGSWEIYLSGLDAAGNFMWAIATQGTAGSSVYQPQISLDPSGNIILIGVVEDQPVDVDPGLCVVDVSPNGVAAFIVKLRPGTINSCGPTITITQQPASPTYACENSSASFTTAATGTTNITYQWQKYDGSVFVDLADNATYSGVTTTTLIISNITATEAGEYQCVIAGDLAADVITDVADLVVNNLPAPPNVVNGLNCGPGAVTLTASGGSPGDYRWYTDSPTLIAGEVNDTFTTPVLTSTTSYFVSLVDTFCESNRIPVTATINPLPAKPTITSSILPIAGTVTVCDAAPLVLSAPVGFTSYTWSSGETTDQINVTLAGSYTVTVTDAAGCVSPLSDPVTVITDTTPAGPTVTAASSCGPGSVTLTASGSTNGNYRWYDVATGGTALSGEVNDTFTTPVLTATATYFVSITNGNCESNRVAVTATINAVPVQPVITSSITPVANAISICSTTPLTLSAPAGFSYLWSEGSTTQQITVSASGSYSVVVSSGGCSSPASEAIDVTIIPAPCNNQPPVVTTTSVTTTIGSSVSINLLALITDPDNNLVASSLAIVQGPASGAIASINSGVLDIDYSGINFAGTDLITIEVCDVFGECTQEQLEIKVIGEIEIYNAVSPNNDGLNEFFDLRYIDLLPDTQENKVTIYNRWGVALFEVDNYNEAKAFRGVASNGNELPSGTYFYKIEFTNGRSSITGYLSLKR